MHRAEVAAGPAESAVRPGGVALEAHGLRHVEHDRDRQHVVCAGEFDQLLSGALLDIRGIDHRQPPGG